MERINPQSRKESARAQCTAQQEVGALLSILREKGIITASDAEKVKKGSSKRWK